ncbi:MAG: phosphate acetyltransferase [Candidatus Eremiobacterota bacterium]
MELIKKFYEKAKSKKTTIVLPEAGIDERVIQATKDIVSLEIAKVILLGDEEEIKKLAEKCSLDLSIVTCIDPKKSPDIKKYGENYYELRKNKGMTHEKAMETIIHPLYFGSMLVKEGIAHGLVAGSASPTADVMKATLQIIKTAPGIKSVSSFFIMVVPGSKYGEEGVFIFSDCAVIPNPTSEQLADMAISSSKAGKLLLDWEPKVAMLSFSTCGSASHEMVDKVKNALKLIKEREPALNVDGEMQADAALVPSVGSKKAPGSPVAGKANILIFPDLNAANISYKLVQRLAGAQAIGPILQGLAKPCSDLSRGCSYKEIVDTVAIVASQVE